MSLVVGDNQKIIIDVLEKKLLNNPENFSILHQAGICYTQMGNYEKAEEKFKMASCLKKYDIEAIQYYSYALFKLGKYVNAVNILESALNITPDNVILNHQLSFIYSQMKDYNKSLFYINNAILFSEKNYGEIDLNLLLQKAAIEEHFDKNKAIDIYITIIDQFENNPESYDKLASLVISNFKFLKPLINLNKCISRYDKAISYLRNGDLDLSINSFKKIIQEDKYCYPAYLGISQGLYEKNFGIRKINNFKQPYKIEELVKNYNQLNENEKNIINCSMSVFEGYIERLIHYDSLFTIVPIDTRITDLPENSYLKNKNYENTMPYESLRGIGGTNAFLGVERVRDLMWEVPSGLKFTPASVAHEFAHQVWCILDKEIIDEISILYDMSLTQNDFISNYSSQNVQEYFAEYYAYYIRAFATGQKVDLTDPMLKLIEMLANTK